MNENDAITSGRITFSTDGFFIQLTDNGQFIDLSGDAVMQSSFEESAFNHQWASVLGRFGNRSITGNLKVHSLIASKLVLQSDIALRAFDIFRSPRSGSALDNWLRAERELLRA